MFPTGFRVVLDADVLFPYSLRDTLLRAAEAGAYQLYLSDEILEEMRRNLVETGTTTEEKSLGLVSTIKEAFPEAVAIGYEHLVASMPSYPMGSRPNIRTSSCRTCSTSIRKVSCVCSTNRRPPS